MGDRNAPSLQSAAQSPAASAGKSDNDALLRVVTTVSPLAQYRGERRRRPGDLVIGLVPEGTNSHTFEPPPVGCQRDRRAPTLSSSTASIWNCPLLELAKAPMPRSRSAAIVLLGEAAISPERVRLRLTPSPRTGGNPNPHLWTSPDACHPIRRDRGRAPCLRRRSRRQPTYFAAQPGRLRRLACERWTQRFFDAVATIPEPGTASCLTYHDSFPFFGAKLRASRSSARSSRPASRSPRRAMWQRSRTPNPRRPVCRPSSDPRSSAQGGPATRSPNEAGAIQVSTLRDDDLPGEQWRSRPIPSSR